MFENRLYRDEIVSLCQSLQVKKLELVGSASRSDFDESQSDIDVVVEFEGKANLFNRYFELKSRLERLFERRVDIIQEHAVKNPYVLNSLNRDRQFLYAA